MRPFPISYPIISYHIFLYSRMTTLELKLSANLNTGQIGSTESATVYAPGQHTNQILNYKN